LGIKEARKFLIIRGVFGSIGLPCHFTSMKLVDPSDAISIFTCNIVFTAFISRIYLKERISLAQIGAVVFILTGIMFIAQPSFLINKTMIINNDTIALNSTNNDIKFGISEAVIKTVGLSMAAVSGIVYSVVSIVIKRMAKMNTHFSVMNLYASYFGIPMSLMLATTSVAAGYITKDISYLSEPEFIWDTLYAFLSILLSKIFFSYFQKDLLI